MKLFYLIVLTAGLYTAPAYCQSKASTTDVYFFSKASVTVCNYSTKEVVSTHVFNDVAALEGLGELPYPIHPVFLSALIKDNVLIACKLWNNNKDCSVQEDGRLLVPVRIFNNELNQSEPAGNDLLDNDIFSRPFQLSPIYTLVIDGNKATFTFPAIYAHGRYDFTLEGKFVIELIKNEPQ